MNLQGEIKARRAVPEDLPGIMKLCQQENWNMGLENFQLYFKVSPDTWFVAENAAKEIIACDTYNQLPNGVLFGYDLLIRQDYRGRGISRLFSHITQPSRMELGNSTADSILRYNFLERFGWKMLGYTGIVYPSKIPQPKQIEDTKLVPLTQQLFDKVAAYDKNLILFDRSKFLAEYLMSNDPVLANAVVAIDTATGEVKGYATLRYFAGYFGITPCYADRPDIAWNILIAAATRMDRSRSLFLYVPFSAECVTTMRFVQTLGFAQCDAEIRTSTVPAYEFYVKKLDMRKVYAIHDYWPL